MFRAYRERQFKKVASRIRYTKPIAYEHDKSVVIISMVSESTVDMYLLAIKSFMRNFGYGTIEVIDDGSLSAYSYSVLRHHIPNVQFFKASDVNTYDCPSYVSWRRLFRAQHHAKSRYVIQLDSDTLSVGPLVDVNNHVKNNTGFVTGSNRWPEGIDVQFLNRIVKQWGSKHVQARAEEGFQNIEFFNDGTKYLRACAGFAGYPKNFASVDEIRSLSAQIESYVGEEWKKWGSEQTTTLCLISKCKGSQVLPWPYYQNYKMPTSAENVGDMSLIHFIGSNRFDNGTYTTVAKNIIRILSSAY